MEKFQPLNQGWKFSPQEPRSIESRNDLPQAMSSGEPIVVPGFWKTFPEVVGGDWGAYRHHNYPDTWQAAEAGLYQLTFDIEQADDDVEQGDEPSRRLLSFAGVMGDTHVWLNGKLLGHNQDSFLPFEFDVTPLLKPTANELLVRVDPPPQDRNEHWLQPCGSWVGWFMRGIWQPVNLRQVPSPSIADVFVQPSVRNQRLTVDIALATAPEVLEATIGVEIRDRGEVILMMEPHSVVLMSDSQAQIRLEREWTDARLWSPEDPHLYECRVTMRIEGDLQHETSVRFGFREFWIEDTYFVLNGQRIRLFGDSWHYMGAAQQSPAYARTWFEFAKSVGVNAIRTHAMPYPEFYFDLADEMGMLIIDESAIYGSAGTLAFEEEAFWENCRDHMRRLVKRDRNHPSIIFWSACNETVWKGGDKIFAGLKSLAQIAKAHDPTRFVSFDENDCDVGGAAPLHAGHYGTPAHWDRAWRRDRPLVVHEFSSLYHGGPEYVSPWSGEASYSDYNTRLRFAGEEAADMFDRLRGLGAASITPWNLNWYCLAPMLEAVEEVDEELTSGGAPLARMGPGALALNFGYLSNEPKWHPNPALEPLNRSYRRQRFWLEVKPRQAFCGHRIQFKGRVWNDSGQSLNGQLRIEYLLNDELQASAAADLSLEPHADQALGCILKLPPTEGCGLCRLTLVVGEEVVDSEEWPFLVQAAAQPPQTRRVFVIGDHADDLADILQAQVIDAESLEVLVTIPKATLVLSSSASQRTLHEWISDARLSAWLEAGGRVVVLNDGVSDDASSALAPLRRKISRVFVTDSTSGLLGGWDENAFSDWGPEGRVASTVFERPDTGPMFTPLYVGESSAGLAHTPMVCCPFGKGHVLITGLELEVRHVDTPVARELLIRMTHSDLPSPMRHTITTQHAPSTTLLESVGASQGTNGSVVILDGTVPPSDEQWQAYLARGIVVIINQMTPESAADWSQRLGVSISVLEDERCNVARKRSGGLVQNITNWDLCWVDRDTAQPIVRHTLEFDSNTVQTLVETTATDWRGYQTAHEQKKVAMMLRRIAAFGGSRAAVAELEVGSSRVIINQLLLQEATGPFASRARRILSSWLDQLGVARQLAVSPLTPRERAICRPDGYIAQWAVLGPFTGGDGHPLEAAYIDEASIVPQLGTSSAGTTWQAAASAFAHVDFVGCFDSLPERDRVAYAAVEVYSAQDRSVLLDAPDMVALLAGADGGLKVWLNGAEIGRFDFVRELVLDNDHVPAVPLRQGWNHLLIKIHNPSGNWRFSARFQSASGERVNDLQYRLPTSNVGEELQ